MHLNLSFFEKEVYNKCQLVISDVMPEAESKDYNACRFNLNIHKIVYRQAKVTPKKVGQFVTFWKRNANGIIEPLHETDDFDFYIITTKTTSCVGQFIFPKSVLIKNDILTTSKKEGKRGFRVYPNWDKPQSTQAIKTQKWQSDYFYTIDAKTDFSVLKKLINLQ